MAFGKFNRDTTPDADLRSPEEADEMAPPGGSNGGSKGNRASGQPASPPSPASQRKPPISNLGGSRGNPGGKSPTGSSPRPASSQSIADIIEAAKRDPARPIIAPLLHHGERLLIHGYEETFKSQFAFQMAEAIAAGKPFLGELEVREPLRVGIIETEMKNPGLGERLAKMFQDSESPENIRFLSEEKLKEFRRADEPAGRTAILKTFIEEEKLDVVILDVASDFFRGKSDPNKEIDVAEFFDLLDSFSQVKAWVMIRHDNKPKEGQQEDSNLRIRGSSEWKESPDTIIHLVRKDKSKDRVKVSVGKLRYGRKPVPFGVRWDRVAGRIVPDNPVPFLLARDPLSREQLIQECKSRYGVKDRTVDEWIHKVKGALSEEFKGHTKIFSLNGQPQPQIWHFQDAEDE